MAIPIELISLMDKQPGNMEKKMIEAFVKEKSVESILEIAKISLTEVNSTEDRKD